MSFCGRQFCRAGGGAAGTGRLEDAAGCFFEYQMGTICHDRGLFSADHRLPAFSVWSRRNPAGKKVGRGNEQARKEREKAQKDGSGTRRRPDGLFYRGRD